MDWTTTGCPLPTGTPPTSTVTVRLRSITPGMGLDRIVSYTLPHPGGATAGGRHLVCGRPVAQPPQPAEVNTRCGAGKGRPGVRDGRRERRLPESPHPPPPAHPIM